MTEVTTESTVTSGAEKPIEKYLVFTIKEKQYAIPSKMINEVAALEKVFPLPLVPEYVRGIINRYTIPYALVDISYLFFKDSSAAKKVIVLKQEIEKIAFLIDDVTDIADIPNEKLIKIDQEEVSAINACFEWKDTQVFCLEIDELINTINKDFSA